MVNKILNSIGSRIAEVRRSRKTTQEELADQLGVSPKHISHVENSTSSLSLKNLIQFCTLFDCSLDYLVLGNSNSDVLSKLPSEIIQILNTGSDEDIDRLRRYLDIYIELQKK